MPSVLNQVLGQETAVGTLRRAFATGRVHHAYLFDGPDGVGKERAAFGLAQALVCEKPGSSSEDAGACGECSACLRAIPQGDVPLPKHPDVVLIERGLYDPAQIGRRTPETQDISIDQIRSVVLSRVAYPPHEGRARVFIVRRAEELSTNAANALLKTLEEPGKGTHFVLLSSRADTLLPTIRSRTQRVRFGALPNAVVVNALVERGIETDRAQSIAELANGSMSQAIALADNSRSHARENFVAKALAALDSKDLAAALELAEIAKKAEKDSLISELESLAGSFATRAKKSIGEGQPNRATADAERFRLALNAVQQLEGNAAAQLTVESMMIKSRNA